MITVKFGSNSPQNLVQAEERLKPLIHVNFISNRYRIQHTPQAQNYIGTILEREIFTGNPILVGGTDTMLNLD